jgi:hypothetical protein
MTIGARIKYKLGIATIPFVNHLWPKLTSAGPGRIALDRHVFAITSTIRPSPASLGSSCGRTHFSPLERLDQTLASIASVRAKVPDAFVILLDNSELDEPSTRALRDSVDWLVTFAHEPGISRYRDHRNKGVGEVYMLRSIHRVLSLFRYRLLFKLSGRYQLSSAFSVNDFPTTRFGFLLKGVVASTRLYSVPPDLHRLWGRQLASTFLAAQLGVGIESAIIRGLSPGHVQWLQALGVNGYMGDGAWLAE